MEQKKKACKAIVPSVKGHKGKNNRSLWNSAYQEWLLLRVAVFLPPDLKDLVLVALINETVEAAALVLRMTCINK